AAGPLRAGAVDVALRERERLAGEIGGAPGEGERLLTMVFADRGGAARRGGADELLQVGADALGLGQASARICADPAAVAGDDVAGDRELPVGVVDAVPHLLERGDRPGGALTCRGDRGIQSRV